MKRFWDVVIVLGMPLALAVVSQCFKGISIYIRELSAGRARKEALATANAEMKQVGPDLCMIALGGDFGAGTYIYAAGGPFLLNEFGGLLVLHFVMYYVATAVTILSSTNRVRIWYNNLLGVTAVLLTAGVILFAGR